MKNENVERLDGFMQSIRCFNLMALNKKKEKREQEMYEWSLLLSIIIKTKDENWIFTRKMSKQNENALSNTIDTIA